MKIKFWIYESWQGGAGKKGPYEIPKGLTRKAALVETGLNNACLTCKDLNKIVTDGETVWLEWNKTTKILG